MPSDTVKHFLHEKPCLLLRYSLLQIPSENTILLERKAKRVSGLFWGGAIFMIVRILFLMKMREGVPVIY